MNRELLLKHFNRISEAPDAIPRLRRFILDLAVRGKLVEQNPGDEPASELLKRIQVEKTRLIKEGKIKKTTLLPTIVAEFHPFQLPGSWIWSRLGEVGDWGSGSTPPRGNSEYYGNDITWLKSGELGDSLSLCGSDERVTNFALEKCSFRLNRPGDVLIAMYGATIGKLAILAETAVTNQAVCGCTPFSGVFNKYLYLFLLSRRDDFQGQSEGGAQPNISKVKIVSSPFALPPIAEQHRIVAKVDELMALCDQLEVSRNERETRRDRLVASSLNRISTTTADDAKDATRFHLNHLPRLTARTEHIKQLRQTILNLAVRGKLVEQDPSDEPAAELLKRIQVEKEKLVKEGKIKKEKPINAIMADDVPFGIPSSWSWIPLGELTQLITKGSSPKWQGISYSSKEDGVLFVTSENVGNYCLRKLDEPKYVEKKFNEIEPRSILQYGDILMNLVGASIGRTAVYDLLDAANINQAVALIRLVNPDSIQSTSFLLHYLNSPTAIQFMTSSQVVTAQPNISLTNAREFPIPLPPLAEQHRIVAKVNELMALCDQLEANLTTTETDSRRLLEAVLRDTLEPVIQEAA